MQNADQIDDDETSSSLCIIKGVERGGESMVVVYLSSEEKFSY